MTLPKTVSKPEGVNWFELVWLLYGPPGIGKTTLSAAFRWGKKKPLFLYASPVKYVEAYKKPIPSWSVFKKTVRELQRSAGKGPYSVIVVDVVDYMYNHCRTEVLDKLGIMHESDLEWGKGWDSVKREFTTHVAKLVTCGYPVIFLSHSDTREVKGKLIATRKIVPSMHKRAYSMIAPICDVIGYMGFSNKDADADVGDHRYVYFNPTEVLEAKQWAGLLPRRVESHKDADRTVAEIKAYLTGEKVAGAGPAKRTTKKTRSRRRVARKKE